MQSGKGYKRLSPDDSEAGSAYDTIGAVLPPIVLTGTKVEQKQDRCVAIRLPFRNLAVATVSLPLGGFIFIVVWEMMKNMEAATRTHCEVRNYLPSFSAAVGGLPLSKTVWRVCIALHAGPRFMVTGMYLRYLNSILFNGNLAWAAAACTLNVFEIFGLIGLSFVSSEQNYGVHKNCFCVFLACSVLYMVMLCALLQRCRCIPPTLLELKSLRVKTMLVLINLVSYAFAGYAFLRHNKYCEEGMYTVFALFEYIVILANMAFHMTAFWDFYDKVITIGPLGLGFVR